MLPFQIGRIIFEVAQLREVVPSCQLRASLDCEQQSSHANARKSRMGLTLFDNCRASVSDSEKSKDTCAVERPTSLSPVRLIWAAPTACSPFCAIAGIASNNFNSPLPHLRSRNITDLDQLRAFPRMRSTISPNTAHYGADQKQPPVIAN